MKIIFVLIALVCILSIFGCKSSVDARVSDDEKTRVLELYKTYGILDSQISAAESYSPKQGFVMEATVIVN